MRNTRTFSDIDLNFLPNPATGDISKRYDDNAIKAAVKNLVLTRNYERPFHSEIGSPIKSLLFNPAGPMLNATLKRAITDVIENFEPRVVLMDVNVNSNPDNNSVYVTIVFRIANTQKPINLDVILQRTR